MAWNQIEGPERTWIERIQAGHLEEFKVWQYLGSPFVAVFIHTSKLNLPVSQLALLLAGGFAAVSRGLEEHRVIWNCRITT